MVYTFDVLLQDGTGFSSEPQPLTVLEVNAFTKQPQEISVEWTSGNRCLLWEDQGIQLYIRKQPISNLSSDYSTDFGGIGYALEMYNGSTNSIYFTIDDFLLNGRFCTGSRSFSPEAGTWEGSRDPRTIGYEAAYGELETITSFSLTLNSNDHISEISIPPTRITVKLSGYPSVEATCTDDMYQQVTEPYLEAFAEKQLLLEENGIRLELMGLGANYNDSSLTTVLRLENTTNEAQKMEVYGQIINGTFHKNNYTQQVTLPANAVKYIALSPDSDIMKATEEAAIWDVKILVSTADYITHVLPVDLSQNAAQADPFRGGDTVLLEEQGLRFTLVSSGVDYSSNLWQVAVENTTDQFLYLELLEKTAADSSGAPIDSPSVYISNKYVAPNCVSILEFSGYSPVSTAAARLRVSDGVTRKLLFETEGQLQLPPVDAK